MCTGPTKPSPPPSPPSGPLSMAVDVVKDRFAPLLLELAAFDDLLGFRKLVEDEGAAIDVAAPWYGRSFGCSRRMRLDLRSPLQIAALYGSTSVLEYILTFFPAAIDVNRPFGSDSATALHLAAGGGSASSVDAVRLLLAAAADVEVVDGGGNRAAELIPRHLHASVSMVKSLETLLKASCPCPRVSSPSKEVEAKMGGEKKEYPLDLTLPDIKNGIYGTDEFRMYSFKIKPCSRAYSHDWTECPFVHPGENARRRDPRKYLYSCVPCPEFRKGSCRNGDACEYAHGVFECWLHPAQYRTRLCKDETGCNRRVCFFAHKTEELRSVNPSTVSASGLVVSSPRSATSSLGVSSLDMATAMMLMQPSSPSTSSALAASAWLNQSGGGAVTPTLQLPSSRLKSTLSARDIQLDLDLLALDGYQHKVMDELSVASPRTSWSTNTLAASRPSDYSDLYGSLDPSLLTQLQGLSMKQASGTQFQSPYSGKLPSSPSVRGSPSISGLDHSLATAIMNSRASAFAKRSQSFIDRGAVARQSTLAPTSTAVAPAMGFSDWGSPSGKLDWGVHGEELNKLRKSASFGIRSNGSSFAGLASGAPAAQGFDEPDLSWVQSLVKDGPSAPGSLSLEQQQKLYGLNGGGEFHASEMLPAWAEEPMVA
ncbi:LOW QUALITY PROTEIN: zinc finger CCCH domain-containing protein 33-like [Dioscorea cayenensis subsp. rotundata]|uniref:LOW QUALITY PROTEIN: zinc finger CCCH domain-containing protein 33-like n=1 Tax=Dioscorea cayennensis subsp. rotundata TaxID=55577 RepID=A0AB40C9V5_DIOCR|nr:LOW QUALITY PROTEIN: zinc finger CCCH domain-containing protein 33-like [Dioscorea cayenensis subsp. rotundata]